MNLFMEEEFYLPI